MAIANLGAPCNRAYRAAHDSGPRSLSAISLVVIHDTEGGSAQGIARYFAHPPNADVGSTHLVIDDKACYRCLPDAVIPWAAPGANVSGFHIELCGYARWSRLVWSSHRAMLERAAFKSAYHLRKFHLPPVFRTASELQRKLPGVTTHAEVTKAFRLSDHSDPGRFWPRRYFMGRVRHWYDALG